MRYTGPLAGIRAACAYEGTIRKAIHNFKYRHRRSLAGPLAEMVARRILLRPLQVDLLVPVPLHHRRLAYRGYNQSGLLARELGRILSLPVSDCLERREETRAQAELGAAERRANMRGVFGCIDAEQVFGKRAGVVDDVCTTGATLEDCARALEESGASSVWGIVIARDL